MGLLDDLKAQAEQKNKPAGEQPASPDAEEFYAAQVKQRMLMAKDFFTQLVNHLNEMNLVTQAEYPFMPEGKKLTLRQQGYRAYSDDIPNPRLVSLSFNCILTSPTTYDVRGRSPALAQGELLERYQFKFVKLESRDQNQMVNGARFKLEGPLQVKCVLQFDEAKLIIKLMLTNFIGPGTSQYNLKPEQLDETFLDHLGKYLLRKEAKLFQEDISDDAKAMLRKKMQQEQQQREVELRAAEEQLKAEELARKQNSTKEQLKKAVSQSVAENTEKLKKIMDEQVRDKGEKLKSMFSKLINRGGSETAPEQSAASPAVHTSQTAKPTGNPAVQGPPPVHRQAGQTASAQQNATRPAAAADPKKPTPPKVFQAAVSNPFLKPQDFEPVIRSDEDQTEVNAETKNPAAPLPSAPATPVTAKTPTATMSPAAVQAKSTAQSNASVAKTVNPVLPTKAAVVQAETKKPTAPSPAPRATPATPTPTTSPAALATPAAVPNASVATTVNASLQTKSPAAPVELELELELEPIVPDSKPSSSAVPAEMQKPMAPSPAQTATPATPTPTTSPAAQVKPVVESNASVAKTVNPVLQTKAAVQTQKPTTHSPAQTATPATPTPMTPPAAKVTTVAAPQPKPSSAPPSLSLEDELARDLARFMEKDQQPPSLESETSADPSSTSGELDFDLSAPDALKIQFEDTDKAADPDNSEPKK